MHSIGTVWLWTVFFIVIATVFVIDIVVLRGGECQRLSAWQALGWTLVWIFCALAFNVFLWWYLLSIHGAEIAYQSALAFLVGYLIEKILSVDNMVVILMIFHFFAVPFPYQRRVLLYGVLGAMVLRLAMILLGIGLIDAFHWVLYLFGIFLIGMGGKMLLIKEKESDLAEHAVVKWLQKHIRLTNEYHDEKFFIIQNAVWYATPLLLVVVLVELHDLIFALDSIPAIFAITTDPFIVFTSNVFAILGLRSLYFLLAHAVNSFYLLKYGVAVILMFVGAKLLIAYYTPLSIELTLGVVVTILVLAVMLSVLIPKKYLEGFLKK